MTKYQNIVSENEKQYIDELIELLKYPSISADPSYKSDVYACAEWVAQSMTKSGLDQVSLLPTAGYPVVYGEKLLDPSYPTVLIYGHYDVQPADPIELWHSSPFEPVLKDGKIYARGAADDKGQFYMHLKALEILLKRGELKTNIKCIIEGEEEVGSTNLESFARAYQDKLKCDYIIISDTSMISRDHPSITTGLRGLCYMEVEVTGPNRDLHSGVYGGAVGNPINTLCRMIASLQDDNGTITIPGFYDGILEVSVDERSKMAQAPFDLEAYKKHLDIAEVYGEQAYSVLERVSIRPTLDVNGIWGGYTGEGAKTVIPSKAYAKISMRLVPGQDHHRIAQLFEKHFVSIAPKHVSVRVTPHHGGEAAVTPTDSIAYIRAERAVTETFGRAPIPLRSGGSIPIVTMFKRVLGVDTVLLGFGLDSDAIHSPNEHFHVWNFLKGIETLCVLYSMSPSIK